MRLTLADAAEYLQTKKLPAGMRGVLKNFEKIFGYDEERENRLRRYIAIVRAYSSGSPIATIENEFGCSRQTIHRYARMAGALPRPRHFPAEIRERVIDMYKHGVPVASIAELCNVSQAYVSRTAGEEKISRYAVGAGRNSGHDSPGSKTGRHGRERAGRAPSSK